jgi:hypothetical protein
MTFVLCALMGACASAPNGPFSVDRVYVEPKIAFPTQMYFAGLSQTIVVGAMAGLFGGLGAGVAASSNMRPSNVALDAMVYQEASAALQANGIKTVTGGAGVSRLQLTVGQYGFGEAGTLSRHVRPLVGVAGVLTGPDDKLLWKGSGSADNTDDSLPSVLPENLKNNPTLVAQYLRAAASKACQKLVVGMNKHRR